MLLLLQDVPSGNFQAIPKLSLFLFAGVKMLFGSS